MLFTYSAYFWFIFCFCFCFFAFLNNKIFYFLNVFRSFLFFFFFFFVFFLVIAFVFKIMIERIFYYDLIEFNIKLKYFFLFFFVFFFFVKTRKIWQYANKPVATKKQNKMLIHTRTTLSLNWTKRFFKIKKIKIQR